MEYFIIYQVKKNIDVASLYVFIVFKGIAKLHKQFGY